MSTIENRKHREAIRRALARRAGNAPDARAIATTTITTWQLMVTQLAPLIGVRGVDVLFGRALHLTSRSFPWFVIATDHKDNVALLADVSARIASRETAVAVAASNAVLATFTELLIALIGEPLTEQILAPVWASSPPSHKTGDSP